MNSNKLKNYLDDIISRDVKVDYWFMTKQKVSDFFMELFIAQIVDRYQISDKKISYSQFYAEQFKQNTAMAEKYPEQTGENTFRNTFIAEYLGLINRTGSEYESEETTDAYSMISKYIKTYEDMDIYHELVERQIEKLAFNVLDANRNAESYQNISVFAVMYLYKIMYELILKFGDSRLSFNEFVIFVMRSKNYSEWKQCLELIEQSRKEDDFNNSVYINEIVDQQYVKDIRFHAFFKELTAINYVKGKYFEFSREESVSYVKHTLEVFENSKYCEISDKEKIKEFLCSDMYFDGLLDSNLSINNINDLLSLDDLEESVVEEIIEGKIKKGYPKKTKNIADSTSLSVIDFPLTYKKSPDKSSAPTVRLYSYEKINKRNIEKGNKAEELVVEYEILRLTQLGFDEYARRVEHVSKTKGDGLGYDILSYDVIDGNVVPIYIEVKATSLDEETAFDITKNELDVAKIHGKNYRIYRISSLGDKIAKCFILNGEEMFKKLDFQPMSFKAFKKEGK